MYQDFFSKSPLLALPLMAMFLFIVVFAAIIVDTFGRSGRDAALVASTLPLTPDDEILPHE